MVGNRKMDVGVVQSEDEPEVAQRHYRGEPPANSTDQSSTATIEGRVHRPAPEATDDC